ncbi:hypothetical protein N656DRAFT_90233 [Canariomyces notabilis]|uniref:Uncharacterized protein n=1 Tax=Canariomyces notabilis TaxID=2074819 RepID=A0AAN6TDX2_9PEZI|nr:hypothetical protein N656DRAFT_90233 [Canariomyces arenarius]
MGVVLLPAAPAASMAVMSATLGRKDFVAVVDKRLSNGEGGVGAIPDFLVVAFAETFEQVAGDNGADVVVVHGEVCGMLGYCQRTVLCKRPRIAERPYRIMYEDLWVNDQGILCSPRATPSLGNARLRETASYSVTCVAPLQSVVGWHSATPRALLRMVQSGFRSSPQCTQPRESPRHLSPPSHVSSLADDESGRSRPLCSASCRRIQSEPSGARSDRKWFANRRIGSRLLRQPQLSLRRCHFRGSLGFAAFLVRKLVGKLVVPTSSCSLSHSWPPSLC